MIDVSKISLCNKALDGCVEHWFDNNVLDGCVINVLFTVRVLINISKFCVFNKGLNGCEQNRSLKQRCDEFVQIWFLYTEIHFLSVISKTRPKRRR